MARHLVLKRRLMLFFTPACTLALALLAVVPSFSQVAMAAGRQYMDTTDDFYVYSPEAYKATACYQTADYSPFDISLVSWANISGSYIFNITFQENVNLTNADVSLYFFANSSYTSAADIPPYSFEETFLIDFCSEWSPRICYNLTLQKYPIIHIHDGVTLELNLSSANTYILDPIQNMLPMDQWFFVGLSRVELASAEALDYVNWPRRYANDQLWLTYDPFYWYKVIGIGAAILGVIIVLTIVVIQKKRKMKQPETSAKKE